MFTPVGGIGDILALSKLVYQIGSELKSIPDSAPDYQDLLNELEALDRALKQIYQIQPGVHHLQRLDGIRALASTCQLPLQDFLAKIQKFKKSLGPWHCRRHRFDGFGRGVQWSLMWKEEVKCLRAKLTPKLSAILILLTSQIVDSLATAETDRASIGHKISTKLSLQHAFLDAIKSGQIAMTDTLNIQGQRLTDLQSSIQDHEATLETHLDKQDISLDDLQRHAQSSAVNVENIRSEVALVKADTKSALDLVAHMVKITVKRFSQLQHIAGMILDLLRTTFTMTKEVLQKLLQLLKEFQEVRRQLAWIEQRLPKQMHYPMIYFRDAFNTLTPFPYHVFREWEGARRMVAAIFINRKGLHRVEMGQWFVSHIGKGIPRIEPRFWSHVLQPNDELSMTMVFEDVQAKEGVCPYPSCGADTSSVEIVRNGKYCPRCSRFAQLTQDQVPITADPGAHHANRNLSQASSPAQTRRLRKDVSRDDNRLNMVGPIPYDAPDAPQAKKIGNEDIDEYHYIQVIRMNATEEGESNPTQNSATEYITVFVQEIGQKTLCIRLSKSTDISEVKSLVHERKRIPENRQRLSFAGRQLHLDQTLADAGIEDGNTLHLVQRIQQWPTQSEALVTKSVETLDSDEDTVVVVPDVTSTSLRERPPITTESPYYISTKPISSRNSTSRDYHYGAPRRTSRKHYDPDPYDTYEDRHLLWPREENRAFIYRRLSPTRDSERKTTLHYDSPYYPYPAKDTSDTPSSRRTSRAPLPRPSLPRYRTTERQAKPKSPATRKATEEDARKNRIPAGYSLKNWDPAEEPILLLGSVFDANSLGKWIYDWTVHWHGNSNPLTDVAGELWLLLIKLAGKTKRAEETLPRVRSTDNRELLDDFLDSADRLWTKFRNILKQCETPMLKKMKKTNSKGRDGDINSGLYVGKEFVDTLFGRDRLLESTEKIMTSIRLWDMRFDANCEDILKHPSR